MDLVRIVPVDRPDWEAPEDLTWPQPARGPSAGAPRSAFSGSSVSGCGDLGDRRAEPVGQRPQRVEVEAVELGGVAGEDLLDLLGLEVARAPGGGARG